MPIANENLVDEIYIALRKRPNFRLENKAKFVAQMAHAGQTRISGEEYIEHPIHVADNPHLKPLPSDLHFLKDEMPKRPLTELEKMGAMFKSAKIQLHEKFVLVDGTSWL